MKKIMKKHYMKKIYLYISFTIFLLFMAVLFRDQLYGIFGNENYIAIHLILEILLIVATMSIAIQIWLTSRYTLINKDIYMGSMFMSLSLLQLAHVISYKGMPFFIIESSPYQATWFYIVVRLILPIGLLSILRLKTKKLSRKSRRVSYCLSIAFSLMFSTLIYWPDRVLPSLVVAGVGTTLLKNSLQFVALLVQVILIIYLLKHFKAAPKRSILFITSSIYLIISDFLFTTYKDVHDISNFVGHLFQLSAFTVLFRAIYFSAVEHPYRRMLVVTKHLEKSEKEMYNMAYFDDITKLPNERNILEKIKHHIENKHTISLIVFEIDRMIAIKESLGTFYAEKMIQLIAKRLQKQLNEKCVIGKLRDDQFVVLLNGMKSTAEIMECCKQIQKIIETPFEVQHFSLRGNAHFGIAQFPNHALTEENLLKFAQFAMYEASSIPEHILFYEQKMMDARTKKVELENDLYNALTNDELFLQYQPQLDLTTGQIISVEALVRWKHPIKGIISPGEFIPIAEQSGFIIPFGRWVLETACRQTKEIQRILNQPVKVAVNLSIGQLFQDDFVGVVETILEETDFSPHHLELEITESMTMNNHQIKPILMKLKQLGITVAVDDFGTGYSSLSYLKDFPIDCLKIDRSFVNKIEGSNHNEPLVNMIISVAKHLNLKVVAEGIESIEQLNYLKEHDCDIVQGFLISKPIHYELLVEEFKDIVEKTKDIVEPIKPTQSN